MPASAASLAVVTNIPSPYQVELFDAYSRASSQFTAIYCDLTMGIRSWTAPVCTHDHIFLADETHDTAHALISQADLVVFSGYRGQGFSRLMRLRHGLRKPWAFWGERPGFRFSGLLGSNLRALTQWRIRRAGVPVWGIGDWAVESYRREMGADRLYLNVPYFSDLKRFAAIDRAQTPERGPVRFLYSGSLIQRKGVDILATAFVELVKSGVDAKLTFMGDGPLKKDLVDATSSISNSIEFLGFKQWHELPEVYAAHDILCAPSRYDGWGLIVPEGLAAGMAIVATDKMGSALQLVDDNVGWITRAGDWRSLYEAMVCAARKSPNERLRMIEHGRVIAQRQHVDAGVELLKFAVPRTIEACRSVQLR